MDYTNIPSELNDILVTNMKNELSGLHAAKIFHESKIEYLEKLNIKLNDINDELKRQIDKIEREEYT